MIIDELWINLVHNMCVVAGGFFTPFFRIISLLGEKAWFFLLISFLLLLSKKTRWIGATAILSIFLGFIIADFGLKPLIIRERPYLVSKIYQDYWELAGAFPETNYSMPSGHTLGCAAFFISLFITCKKSMKPMVLKVGIISTILMIFSRTYFMHHHLTDCLVGVVIAIFTSYLSKVIVKLIYKFIKANEDIGLFNFILNFDVYKKRK